MRRKRLRLKVRYIILFILCGLCLIIMILMNSVMTNVHLSENFVQHRAVLYPAVFKISSSCSWYTTKPHNIPEFKPPAFVLMARALTDVYKQYDIKFLLREGSLLHVYRHKPADDDMDMWMIVPKHMTMKQAYENIVGVLRGNVDYKDITFEYQNLVLVSILFQYSDAVRVSYKGIKLIDINVLHETFLNDPDVQKPCWKQMMCDIPMDDKILVENYHIVLTKNLFQNLCKCPFMDSTFFCFTQTTEYLHLRYGMGFMKPTARKNFVKPRDLIYERPFKIWRKVILFLHIFDLARLYFQNHDIYKEQVERENIVQFYKYVNKTKSIDI